MCDVQDDELIDGASRGAKVLYKFPWGTETLETLWMLGDAELLKSHLGNRDKLQVSGNVFPAEYISRPTWLFNLTKVCNITAVVYAQRFTSSLETKVSEFLVFV